MDPVQRGRATRLPAGVRDFLPDAASVRIDIVERLLETFARWGYRRIITPLFECADVLERGIGSPETIAFRFIEPGSGEVVAIRPDMTPQVARLAARRLTDRDGPIRFCYEGSVMRTDASANTREVLQVGVEVIGEQGNHTDVEMIALAADALDTALPPAHSGHRQLDLGHVAVARHLFAAVDPTVRSPLHTFLAIKDREGIRSLRNRLPDPARSIAEALPSLHGPFSEVLARALALPLPARVQEDLRALDRTLDDADGDLPGGRAAVTLDLGDVRGWEYYTGLRLNAYADGASRAVLGGGRYDHLVERYGRRARAIGFALDVEAIADAQRRSAPAVTRVLVAAAAPANRGHARALARILRSAHIHTAVHPDPIDDHLPAYARRCRFTHLLIAAPTTMGTCLDRSNDSRAFTGTSAPDLVEWVRTGQ